MRGRLTGKLTVACLVVAAFATGCDRKTPSGPDGKNQSDVADWEMGAGARMGPGTFKASITLAEGGDVCIPVTAEPLVIVKNTRLTCDMKCETGDMPCIEFGASGIKLDLNGFNMTGPSEPPASCAFVRGDGIHSTGRSDIVIEGPGLVQKFRRHGIALLGVSKATVKKVASHQNCFSGVFLANTRETLVEEVVSVRNGSASDFRPCGGVCITSSDNNRVRRSEIAGNGSTAAGANDFGIGLIGTSTGNTIEENGIGGNINGILVMSTALRNVIRKNVIAGNPPIQVGSPPLGFDIQNLSPAGTNRFEENLCITSTGDPPCLRLPSFAGHQNN